MARSSSSRRRRGDESSGDETVEGDSLEPAEPAVLANAVEPPPSPPVLPELPLPVLPKSDAVDPSELSPLRRRLLQVAPAAIEALAYEASYGEGAPRVNAAAQILDRVGLVKPREPPSSDDLSPAILIAAMKGIAGVFGERLSEAAESRLRDVSPVLEKTISGRKNKSSSKVARALAASQESEP